MTVSAKELVISKRRFLDSFNRQSYDEAFKEYCKECESAFDAVEHTDVAEDINERELLLEAAEGFVQELSEEWETAEHSNRRRRLRMLQDRTLIAVFLAPAAIEYGERCGVLAEALEEAWRRRFPKEEFHVGTYEVISEGFRPRIKWLDGRPFNNRK